MSTARCRALSQSFSRKFNSTMDSKKVQAQQILAGEIAMDTQTRFHANGDINIFPCSWVDEQVTTGGVRKPRGRMTIEEDGTSHFKAYRTNTGPKYEILFETAHGVVKMTRPIYRSDREHHRRRMDLESVYVTFRFPKTYGLALTKALYEEEADQIMSFLKTRKEETIWK